MRNAHWQTLQPGDPWTIIRDEPIVKADRTLIGVGDLVSKWFATNEPGRLFKVVRVHQPATYETQYVGFAPPFNEVAA